MSRKHSGKRGNRGPVNPVSTYRKAKKQRQAMIAGSRGTDASVSSIVDEITRASGCLSLELRIVLKSDLCAGSGDGFSSGIDQDVCYDGHGLPYIPARRLKGCLRQAAQDIGLTRAMISSLFGESGMQKRGCLTISNASMYGASVEGGTSATLERYTYTRAQTKIDPVTGSAADNTLRFVRVVKHYMPDGAEAVFVAPVLLDRSGFDSDEAVAEAFRALLRCFRGMRNIGMGRNRGFGAVRCEGQVVKTDSASERSDRLSLVHEKRVVDKTALSYVVTLDSPVMLPQMNGSRSHECIPGTSVMGFFASRLKNREDFDELFFGGRVHFSPLYPVDEQGCRCLPAASFLARIKGGSRDGQYCRADAYDEGPLESLKPLNGGFVSPRTWCPVDVNTEIVYHHSTGEDGTLYTQECLSPGQMMAGFIECPSEWTQIFKDALVDGNLFFGRSKTAQYARCSLRACEKDYSDLGTTLNVRSGESYALLLESDFLPRGLASESPSSAKALMDELVAAGIDMSWLGSCDVEARGLDSYVSRVSSRTLGGYNAKWNHHKPQVRVFEAGSCLVFDASSDYQGCAVCHAVGSRSVEGMGRVRLVPLNEVHPSEQSSELPLPDEGTMGTDTAEKARLLAVAYADGVKNTYFCGSGALESSFVSRLTMMVDESTTKETISFDEDLDARIDSIKNEAKRDRAVNLVAGLRDKLGGREWCATHWQEERDCLLLVLTLGKYYGKQKASLGGGAR